jgi:hypothetical protein
LFGFDWRASIASASVVLFALATAYVVRPKYRVFVVNNGDTRITVDAGFSDGSESRTFELERKGVAMLELVPKRDSSLRIEVTAQYRTAVVNVGYFEPRSGGRECFVIDSRLKVAGCEL